MAHSEHHAYPALFEPDQMRARMNALAQVLDGSGQVLLREQLFNGRTVPDTATVSDGHAIQESGFGEPGPVFDESETSASLGADASADDIAYLAQVLGRSEGMVAAALEALARKNAGARDS